MSEYPQNRDKDVRKIEIKVEQSSSMEKIEEEIRLNLKSHHVDDLMRHEGNEICLCILSVGPHG